MKLDINPVTFIRNETELKKLLEKEPDRIERGMRHIASNIKLPLTSLLQYFRGIRLRGKIDLLMKDKNGCPVIVEVKGETSPEERRKGVYQLIEYSLYFSGTWVTPRLIYLTYQSIRLENELFRFDIEPMFWDDIGIGRKNERGLHPVYPKGTKLSIPKRFYYYELQKKYKQIRKHAKFRVKKKNHEVMSIIKCDYEDFWEDFWEKCNA